MADVIKMLNTIRKYASENYQNSVPVATRDNFTTVGIQIMDYTKQSNEFVDILVNRIGMTVVNNRTFKNPLSVLGKGGIPFGQDVQEIYTNPASSTVYDGTSTELLAQFKPTTAQAFYRMNRQAKFRVSVRMQDLGRAFTSMNAFNDYVSSIINSMYNGDEIEQFELTKGLVSHAFENDCMKKIDINTDTGKTWTEIDAMANSDEYVAKWLVKNVMTYSKLLTFPSTKYNSYKTQAGSAYKDVKTWTPLENQILLLPSNIDTNMNVEVLAYAFNVDKTTIKTRTLVVDAFNDSPILGVLCDEKCFQIYENGTFAKSFDNGENLSINYWLHHWQTYGFSPIANSIAFTYTPALPLVLLLDGSLGTAGNAKITGLTPSTQYILTNEDAEVTVTTNASGEIINLKNEQAYFVKAVS